MANKIYGFLGCGTMGRCILTGLLDTKFITSNQVIASVNSESSFEQLQSEFEGIKVTLDNEELVRQSDVIVLGVKPQMAISILQPLEAHFNGKILISICAGLTLANLRKALPSSPTCIIVRAMPNTPCKIREGMIVLSNSFAGNASVKELCVAMFSPLGRVRILEEKCFDAVTALSGSGPAFACVVLEAFADGGVMMGIPRNVAIELAAQTLQGAARMVLQSKKHPAQIKDEVTTPGGCTIAGLLAMEDGKIRSVLARAIQEATNVIWTRRKINIYGAKININQQSNDH